MMREVAVQLDRTTVRGRVRARQIGPDGRGIPIDLDMGGAHGGDLTEIEITVVCAAVERIVQAYLDLRQSEDETFIEAYRRLGLAPFKAYLYPEAQAHAA